ncbi:hypothetical protein MMPV_000709 [Pyropia vietnamensis]
MVALDAHARSAGAVVVVVDAAALLGGGVGSAPGGPDATAGDAAGRAAAAALRADAEVVVEVLTDGRLAGAPVLVWANKMDLLPGWRGGRTHTHGGGNGDGDGGVDDAVAAVRDRLATEVERLRVARAAALATTGSGGGGGGDGGYGGDGGDAADAGRLPLGVDGEPFSWPPGVTWGGGTATGGDVAAVVRFVAAVFP